MSLVDLRMTRGTVSALGEWARRTAPARPRDFCDALKDPLLDAGDNGEDGERPGLEILRTRLGSSRVVRDGEIVEEEEAEEEGELLYFGVYGEEGRAVRVMKASVVGVGATGTTTGKSLSGLIVKG